VRTRRGDQATEQALVVGDTEVETPLQREGRS
jgi:hypothetical protein